MRPEIIVGLAGHKGAGKDTVADYLIEKYGFVKGSFAAPLKRALCGVFGFKMHEWESLEWKETPNALCYGLTPRSLAQTLGTNWGRDMVNTNVWVDAAMRDPIVTNNPRVVFSDVRFDNEAEAIRAAGGVIIRLSKFGYVSNDAHASEVGISNELTNYEVTAQHGALGSLRNMVGRYIERKFDVSFI